MIPVNQRPVRCRQELGGACQAKEELEATSRLALRTCGLQTNALATEPITADVCLCESIMQNRLEGLIASQGGKNGNGETRLTRALDDGQRYGLLPRSRRP